MKEEARLGFFCGNIKGKIISVFVTFLFVMALPAERAEALSMASPGEVIINEILADPAAGIAGDANGDGIRSAADDEFIELVNVTSYLLDIGFFQLHDALGLKYAFPESAFIEPGQSLVVFGGGSPAGYFGGAQIYTAPSGLGLNNGGDRVTLLDVDGNVIDEVLYGGEGGDDQSLTRDPDLTGLFVKHTLAAGTSGALFSPGTLADGSLFVSQTPEPGTFFLLGSALFGLALFRKKRPLKG